MASANTSPVCLCRLLSSPTTDWFGERQRQARFGGVVAQQPRRVGHAGHGHAVLRFRVVDGVAADHRAARLRCHRQSAAQHLRHQLQGQQVAGPADQVDRDDRAPAHRVNVRKGVRRGDSAPVVSVVDDRCEEVRRGEHCDVADQDRGRVVAVVEPDQNVVTRLPDEPAHRLFEFTGRDLARAAAAVRVAGEPRPGHAPSLRASQRAAASRSAREQASARFIRGGVWVPGGPPGLQNR